MVVVEGNMKIPPFLLPKWNGICAIPPYIDASGKCNNATFLTIA